MVLESDSPANPAASADEPSSGGPNFKRFVAATLGVSLLALAGIWQGNRAFAPEMYTTAGVTEIATALAANRNYAVFDLNINIRELRDQHIARLDYTPDVIVLGASHWQEAHAQLIPHKRMFNAHVHRDYYEDILGVTEILVRHNRLPKQMIIAIRDNQFAPIPARRDHLWLPGIPYYRLMAKRLDIKAHSELDTLPVKRWMELASLPMLHNNAVRWLRSTQKPNPTVASELATLDLLLPDGSIVWSQTHRASFTPERTAKVVAEFAAARAENPPQIELAGVQAVDKLLSFLTQRGVELFLAHPPFHPDFYNRMKGTKYIEGLAAVEQVTRDLALKHGARIIGSFDPSTLGCTGDMYIDAEHSNPDCLSRLFNQFNVLDAARSGVPMAARKPSDPRAVAAVTDPSNAKATALAADRGDGAARAVPPTTSRNCDARADKKGRNGAQRAECRQAKPATRANRTAASRAATAKQ